MLIPLLLAGILMSLPAQATAPSQPMARYFGMRHGESVPSSQQRICSAMAAGIDPRNGLTERGRQEAQASSDAWIAAHGDTIRRAWQQGGLWIVSSPFSRSRETAEILVERLQHWQRQQGPALAIRLEADLRERDFGRLDGQSPSGPLYRRVWDQDATDPSGTPWGVESAAAVQRRGAALMARLEREAAANPDRVTVLVSHGDTLKILQTSAQGQSAAAHQDPSRVKPFQTGEIRALIWAQPPAPAAGP
ncbi:MAG: histidine phosphatase family protein [Cyanobium sp. LacPavin_0818_WC50_MAG_67_9]|nr:histidine phosphatase family protein [Cyanobium sp. LacPavin_0818_WC50_MAG_67_9]